MDPKAPKRGPAVVFPSDLDDLPIVSRTGVEYNPGSRRLFETQHGSAAGASAPKTVMPDRLSIDPKSVFHDAELIRRGVGVRFKGVERTNVKEYCLSEGWVRLLAGAGRDRNGNQLTVKLQGIVEVWMRDEV